MFGWLRRAYHHPAWIPALSGVALASLVGTMVLFSLFITDQRSERSNRINADVTACERGNRLRSQVIAVGDANEEMLQGVVDVVLPRDSVNGERAQRIREIRAALEPVFDRHRDAIDDIELIDCQAVTPGAPQENP